MLVDLIISAPFALAALVADTPLTVFTIGLDPRRPLRHSAGITIEPEILARARSPGRNTGSTWPRSWNRAGLDRVRTPDGEIE